MDACPVCDSANLKSQELAERILVAVCSDCGAVTTINRPAWTPTPDPQEAEVAPPTFGRR